MAAYNNMKNPAPRLRGFRVELLPNNRQRTRIIAKADGKRFAYNWALRKLMGHYEKTGKVLSDGLLRKEFTKFKALVRGLASDESKRLKCGEGNIPKDELPLDVRTVCKYYYLQDVAALCNVANNVTKQAIRDVCNAYKRFDRIQKERARNKLKPVASKKYNRLKHNGKEPGLYDRFAHPKFRCASNPRHQKFFEDVDHVTVTNTHIVMEKLMGREKPKSRLKKITIANADGTPGEKKAPRFRNEAAVKLAEPGRIPAGARLFNLRVTIDADGRIYLGGCYDLDSYAEPSEAEIEKIANPRVRKNVRKRIRAAERWEAKKFIPKGTTGIGIDVGERKHAVLSDGTVYETKTYCPKMLELEDRGKAFQKRMARKYRLAKEAWLAEDPERDVKEFYYHPSNKYKEAKARAFKYTRKRANIRHEEAARIAREILERNPLFVSHEHLNVQGMAQNRTRARKTMEALYGEIFRILEYRGMWQGIPVFRVDRFFASSKTCSVCGHINKHLGSNETLVCERCGAIIDRDYNAAVNLHNYGAEMFNEARKLLIDIKQFFTEKKEFLAELAFDKEQEESFSLLA